MIISLNKVNENDQNNTQIDYVLNDIINLTKSPKDFSVHQEDYAIQNSLKLNAKENGAEKILAYNKKIRKWREIHPLNRKYSKKSKTASQSQRIKGRFISNKKVWKKNN